jgi:KipI family sensor histidine kinase inhibitor
MLTYDLNRITHADFCHEVESILSIPFVETKMTRTDITEIPVYYGSEVGLDLALVLKRSGLSLAELIELHSGRHYLTYAIGFSPVFAFLGSLDQQIHFPRLATPRISIPAGSVGIAGEQTAVYPIQSSGGWNIIGRTPLDLSLTNPFNIERFEVGTYVKFVPISREQYLMQGGSL